MGHHKLMQQTRRQHEHFVLPMIHLTETESTKNVQLKRLENDYKDTP